MKTLFAWHKRFQNLVNWIIGLALMVLLCVILLQTFTRYVIFHSLPWSEELSRYLFVLLILWGVNIGITKENFVRIDVIDAFVPTRLEPYMAIFRDTVALFVASMFIYSTTFLVRIGKFQKSPAMRIQMDIMYYIVLIGFILAAISLVLKIASRLLDARKGETA